MDTQHTPDEIQLLILCTKVSLSPEDILSIEDLSFKIEMPYHVLIKLAYQHAVIPQLYHTFKTNFPEHPITQITKPYYFSIIQTNMAMSSDLIKITELLNSQYIHTLCFKGPGLATQAYGDITLRQYGDLDILIRKQDKDKALTLLFQKKYIPEITLHPYSKKTFFSKVNVLGFQSPQKHVFVEIHWELLSKNYAIQWDESNLWEETQNIYINEKQLKTLSHTNHFLYLCAHGSKHLYERLSWVSDIDHYIQTQSLHWEEIFTEAKSLGIVRILLISLYLAKSLLNTPLPKEVTTKIAQDPIVKKIVKEIIFLHFSNILHNEKSIHSFRLLWNMREKVSDKLRFAWYALFATKLDDFRFIQLPPYLDFFYTVIRPLRLLIKYLK
ncbi:hypothetical protein C9926_01575 [Sulfurovum lithotrophicum]|nr:hypothetical protein C9926_01575 [Sulfurovum lithotrophicum]